MGIGRILLSPHHFFHTPNLLQLPLNHPPCCPPTHTHLHTGPRGCFVHHWNVHVELCVWPLSCSMSEGVRVQIAWSVALEKLADDREEARHMSSVLRLPWSH